MDQVSSLKLLYDNYNKIFLQDSLRIIKVFHDKTNYLHEIKIYEILNNLAPSICPRIISYSDRLQKLEIEYIVAGGRIHTLDDSLEVMTTLRDIDIKYVENNLKADTEIRRDLSDHLAGLEPIIGSRRTALLANMKIEDTVQKSFIHGDLRTSNIILTEGKWKLIDFESSCVGDVNVDYSYVFLDYLSKGYDSSELLNLLSDSPFFNYPNFRYHVIFTLSMMLKNPKNNEQEGLKVLDQLIK